MLKVDEVIARFSLSGEQINVEEIIPSSSLTSLSHINVQEVQNSNSNDQKFVDEENTPSEATNHEVESSPTSHVYERQ